MLCTEAGRQARSGRGRCACLPCIIAVNLRDITVNVALQPRLDAARTEEGGLVLLSPEVCSGDTHKHTPTNGLWIVLVTVLSSKARRPMDCYPAQCAIVLFNSNRSEDQSHAPPSAPRDGKDPPTPPHPTPPRIVPLRHW